MSLRQRDVIQKSCSICTPALIVRLEFKLPLKRWQNGCDTATWSGRHPSFPSLTRFIHKASLWQYEFWYFYHSEQPSAVKKISSNRQKGFLPSGQAATPKLIIIIIVIVNASFTVTLLETLTTFFLTGKIKKKAMTSFPRQSGFWLCSLAKK